MNTVRHVLRAARRILSDDTVPRPLRWLAGVGLLPIPGPLDEAVLVFAGVVLVVFYRDPLRSAWKDTA